MSYSRRLPHIVGEGEALFITWHLFGSLPSERYPPPRKMNSGEAFVWMDQYLDQKSTGWLKKAEVAGVVEDAIRDYDPHAYVIMPNHVHLLITPTIPLPKLMQAIKGRSAREANRLIGVSGKPFWQQESYDHLVRNPEEFRRIERYIENNPVKAGLAPTPEKYRWSSAWWRGLQPAATASAGG
jgi:REP-associated tyrosine transposase